MLSFHGRGRCGPAVASLILAAGLAGCATKAEPVIRTVEAKVPVPVSCVPDSLPPPPTYPDSDKALKAAPSGAERYQLIQAGRILRIQRQAETEPVIAGCRAKP